MKKNKIITFVLCLIIVYAAGIIGSLLSFNNTSSEWFDASKPSITPPSYFFPIVWNILYFMIAFSLFLAWTNSNKKDKLKVAWVFGINLVLNAVWTFLFFGLKNPTLAFIDIILIWITIVWMIVISYKIDKTSAYLLIPYLLWVSFATLLNYLSI